MCVVQIWTWGAVCFPTLSIFNSIKIITHISELLTFNLLCSIQWSALVAFTEVARCPIYTFYVLRTILPHLRLFLAFIVSVAKQTYLTFFILLVGLVTCFVFFLANADHVLTITTTVDTHTRQTIIIIQTILSRQMFLHLLLFQLIRPQLSQLMLLVPWIWLITIITHLMVKFKSLLLFLKLLVKLLSLIWVFNTIDYWYFLVFYFIYGTTVSRIYI